MHLKNTCKSSSPSQSQIGHSYEQFTCRCDVTNEISLKDISDKDAKVNDALCKK
jgi:hypothetical protein